MILEGMLKRGKGGKQWKHKGTLKEGKGKDGEEEFKEIC